jgi:hypothetical protein
MSPIQKRRLNSAAAFFRAAYECWGGRVHPYVWEAPASTLPPLPAPMRQGVVSLEAPPHV